MIAMALMCDPDLLMADEPRHRRRDHPILRFLTDLQRELGIALVLMTHDLGIVARIAVMYAGEMAARQVSGGGANSIACCRYPIFDFLRIGEGLWAAVSVVQPLGPPSPLYNHSES